MIRLDYVTSKSKSCSLYVAIKPKFVSVISVLCLSFGNENEIWMCHDYLYMCMVIRMISGLSPEGFYASDYIRTKIRRHLCELLYPG